MNANAQVVDTVNISYEEHLSYLEANFAYDDCELDTFSRLGGIYEMQCHTCPSISKYTDEQGVKRIISRFNTLEYTGQFSFYDKRGRLKYQGKFDEGGIPVDKWNFYKKSGKLKKTFDYGSQWKEKVASLTERNGGGIETFNKSGEVIRISYYTKLSDYRLLGYLEFDRKGWKWVSYAVINKI